MTLNGLPKLTAFLTAYPRSRKPLEAWKTLIEKNAFRSIVELKSSFGSADYSAPDTIFDIGGNKFRIIAVVNYQAQVVIVKEVFTHARYEAWSKRRKQ